MGIADDVGDAGESEKFFRGALGVAAGDDDFGGGILGVNFADSVAGLGVSGGSYGAGIEDYHVGGVCRIGEGAATIEELTFDGGTVGLGGAAAELFDVEGGHRFIRIAKRDGRRRC